jgi:hypothetical protein
VLVLENADVSPSELWNKIMTGNRIPFSPQKPYRLSTSMSTNRLTKTARKVFAVDDGLDEAFVQ